MTDAPILTTKECEKCGHVFLRYMNHLPGREPKREQQICPECGVPRFLVEVEHLGESL